MKNFIKTIVEWVRKRFRSDREIYLENAIDRADFEHRLKNFENNLQYPNYKHLPIYFV